MKRGVFGGLAVCGSVVLALLCLAPLGVRAYGDEPAAPDGDIVTVTARAHSVDPDGWSATVTYEKPQAGIPTEFVVIADGGPKGSGSYQYQQGLFTNMIPMFGSSIPPSLLPKLFMIPMC